MSNRCLHPQCGSLSARGKKEISPPPPKKKDRDRSRGIRHSHFKLPLGLPRLVRKPQHHAPAPRRLQDPLDRRSLLAGARDRLSVRQARARPAGLQVEGFQAGAEGLQGAQGLGDERAGGGGGDGAVEEGVDVRGDDVQGGA